MTHERRQWIAARLKVASFLSFEQMKEKFPDVSEMTLRRDIEFLEKSGEAIKVRGGARSTRLVTDETDDPYRERAGENTEQKIRIARKAAEMLEVGRSIFIDSGTTAQSMVQFVPNERFVFTTTSPLAALDLCRIGLPVVNLVGGKLDRDYQSVSGMQAMKFLADVNIDTAVLCPSGFSAESGFTGGNFNECEMKRTIIEKAHRVIMLMDSTKAGKSLPYTFCKLSDIDALVTDDNLPDFVEALCVDSGVEIIKV